LQDEYGNCFTPDRVASFMSNAFDYLNGLEDEELGYALDGHRLVQQWTWFSIYTDAVGTVSNILENDQQTLSVIGEKYRQIVFAEPPVVNLLIEDIPAVNLSVDPAAGTATAPLSVTFRNNGNTAVNEPFTVSFFADQARQQMIGTVIINEPARGCATNVYRTVLNWPNLAPGQHRFWVTVDGGDRIVEGPPGQADNRGTGLVTVYPESTYFPIIIH